MNRSKQATTLPTDTAELPLTTIADVPNALAEAYNAVRTGRLAVYLVLAAIDRGDSAEEARPPVPSFRLSAGGWQVARKYAAMNPKRGSYSPIQYCPDPGRLEVVNLGVLLFCPEIGFLEAKMGSNHDRVRKFFGRESFDNWALIKAKQALVARLHVDKDHLLTPENLENFILTRANEIILSPLRPVKVLKNPQKELADLFRELVGKEQRQRRPKLLVPELEAVFQRLHKEGRAVVDFAIKVPVIGRTVRVPYAYHNGAMHLVKPERFSDIESVATETAMKLAVEGDLLKRYGRDQDGEKRLVVVSSFAGDQPHPDVQDRVARVLREYQVKAVLPADLPQFVADVEEEAH